MELQQIDDSNFKKSTVVITESITLNDANTVTGVAHIVTNQSMLTIDDSVTPVSYTHLTLPTKA